MVAMEQSILASTTSRETVSGARKSKYSKVFQRVARSNRRVLRVSRGKHLEQVVKLEQYEPVGTEVSSGYSQKITRTATVVESTKRARDKKQERVYCRARVALQCPTTGLYLSASRQSDVCSVSEKSETKFLVINLDDPESTAPLSFGQRIGLQFGNRVIGAKFVRGEKDLHVRMVPYDDRAIFMGKWRIIAPKPVSDGDPLVDLSTVAFEHNSSVLSSRDASLVPAGGGWGKTLWKLHLVSNAVTKQLPTAHRVLNRAKAQIHNSAETRPHKALFPFEIRQELQLYERQSDCKALSHDPTDLSNNDVNKYLSDRHVNMFTGSAFENKKRYGVHPAFLAKKGQIQDDTLLLEDTKESASMASSPKPTQSTPFQAVEREHNELLQFVQDTDKSMKKKSKTKKKVVEESSEREKEHKKRLEFARAKALASQTEMKVPTVVWQQIRIQGLLLEKTQFEKLLYSTTTVQRVFRKWRKKKWTRTLNETDNNIAEQTAIDLTNTVQEAKSIFKPPKLENDKTQERTKKSYSYKSYKSKKPPYLSRKGKRNVAPMDTRKAYIPTRTQQQQENAHIIRHFSILRQSNKSLFDSIPPNLLTQPTDNGKDGKDINNKINKRKKTFLRPRTAHTLSSPTIQTYTYSMSLRPGSASLSTMKSRSILA